MGDKERGEGISIKPKKTEVGSALNRFYRVVLVIAELKS